MTELLLSFAQKFLPDKISADSKIEKLFGQASSRQYFRISPPLGTRGGRGELESHIIMQLPQGFSSPAEEITKTHANAPQEFPFINVQKYLKKLAINVPDIFGYDAKLGLILLEDLGDTSLENLVSKTDEHFFMFYYKNVVETLVELQTKTLEHPAVDCIAGYRRFDAELLHWEFMHFLEYGIEDRFKIKVSDEEHQQFDSAARTLAQDITQLPYGFTHRDFQSRNIHFKNYNFYLIDFQDALLGPLIYDLVALLRDSYIKFMPDQRDVLIKHYVDLLPVGHPYHGKYDDVKSDFHLVALQRKLKDAGRFQYINTVKGNSNFLKSVPQSLEYVRESFGALLSKNPSIGTSAQQHIGTLNTIATKYLAQLT